MALKEYKCVQCEKKFREGQWLCESGVNHVVEAKRYYMNDAPTIADASGNVDKHASTQILNIPPERRVMGPDGQERVVPGGNVWFIRGIFETTDPEQQHWLDRKGGFVTEREHKDAYFSDKEKLDMERMELNAMRQRYESERNELLASVQKKA